MTAPQQPPPAAPPDGNKQQAEAAAEPRDRDSRRPEFVFEIWASPQLRDRNPSRAPSLSEALRVGRRPAAGRDQEPDPELEMEP